MALIKCPDCGKEVSDTAKTCIGCGRPMERTELKEKRKASILTWVLTIAIAGGLVSYLVWEIVQTKKREKLIEKWATYSYNIENPIK